jgi:uncharacterized protein (TIGR02001 family)
MKLKQLSALCLAGTMLTASSLAMAWESEDGAHSTSASVALASDYVWRGYSQTDEDPAISGSFDYGHSSGLYAGVWASNVDFDDDASSEIDIYAGFSSEFGDSGIGYDVGILRYIYDSESYDWNEVYASLSYSYFSVGVAHSGSVYDSSEDGTYYSAGFDYDLPYDIAFSSGIGYYDYDSDVSDDDHTDYRIGISKEMIGFDFGLTYTGMDSDGEDAYGDLADDRVVISISKSM